MNGPPSFSEFNGRTAYEVLGVNEGATADQIAKAYRSLMRTVHPDVGGTAEQAQMVNAAVLWLTKHRHDYDRHLEQKREQDRERERAQQRAREREQRLDQAREHRSTGNEPGVNVTWTARPAADPHGFTDLGGTDLGGRTAYEVLGVAEDAHPRVIDRAYLELLVTTGPDQADTIDTAYRWLTHHRGEYDRYLKQRRDHLKRQAERTRRARSNPPAPAPSDAVQAPHFTDFTGRTAYEVLRVRENASAAVIHEAYAARMRSGASEQADPAGSDEQTDIMDAYLTLTQHRPGYDDYLTQERARSRERASTQERASTAAATRPPQPPRTDGNRKPEKPVKPSPRPPRTQTGGWNRNAVIAVLIALVLPIIGAPVCVALGIIALRQIQRTRERGRGLAVLAIIISVLDVVAAVVLFAMN